MAAPVLVSITQSYWPWLLFCAVMLCACSYAVLIALLVHVNLSCESRLWSLLCWVETVLYAHPFISLCMYPTGHSDDVSESGESIWSEDPGHAQGGELNHELNHERLWLAKTTGSEWPLASQLFQEFICYLFSAISLKSQLKGIRFTCSWWRDRELPSHRNCENWHLGWSLLVLSISESERLSRRSTRRSW